MIKAIETVYNGYKFRSRLEARWAVFFDAMDVKWIYEPEGFKLSSGEYYLPDFYFPDIEFYGEVKPFLSEFTPNDPRWTVFITDAKTGLIILKGMPGEHVIRRIMFWEDRMCKKCKQLVNAIEFDLREGEDIRCGDDCCKELESETGISDYPFNFESDDYCYGNLETSYTAAKQARFEHGAKF